MDYLLEQGAPVDTKDVSHIGGFSMKYITILIIFSQSSNWTGLILASKNGHLGVVKKLLDKGADVNSEEAHVRIMMNCMKNNTNSRNC